MKMERKYSVETLENGKWVIHRFARFVDALKFAGKEMKRINIGLSVHMVDKDLIDWRYTGINWIATIDGKSVYK